MSLCRSALVAFILLALILVGLAVVVAGQRNGKGRPGKPPEERPLAELGAD